jgi:hypothetical protein
VRVQEGGTSLEAIKSLFKRDKSAIPKFLEETNPDPKLWNEILKEQKAK